MSIVFSDIEIDSMNFVNDKHDLKFEFYDTVGANRLIGTLTCTNIFSLKLDTNFDRDEESPFRCFMCDVRVVHLVEPQEIELKFTELGYGYYDHSSLINEDDGCYFVSFDGGQMDIKMLCGQVEIYKADDFI